MTQDTRLCVRCTKCGSYAINGHLHGREPGKHPDLCDVCYWRAEAKSPYGRDGQEQRIRALESEIAQLKSILLSMPSDERVYK